MNDPQAEIALLASLPGWDEKNAAPFIAGGRTRPGLGEVVKVVPAYGTAAAVIQAAALANGKLAGANSSQLIGLRSDAAMLIASRAAPRSTRTRVSAREPTSASTPVPAPPTSRMARPYLQGVASGRRRFDDLEQARQQGDRDGLGPATEPYGEPLVGSTALRGFAARQYQERAAQERERDRRETPPGASFDSRPMSVIEPSSRDRSQVHPDLVAAAPVSTPRAARHVEDMMAEIGGPPPHTLRAIEAVAPRHLLEALPTPRAAEPSERSSAPTLRRVPLATPAPRSSAPAAVPSRTPMTYQAAMTACGVDQALAAIERHGGNKAAAARELKLTRVGLYGILHRAGWEAAPEAREKRQRAGVIGAGARWS